MGRYFMFQPKFLLLLGVAMVVVFIFVFASQGIYIGRQLEHIASLEFAKAALVSENQSLSQEIDYTYTDEYIEREARAKWGLVKPGEVLYESTDF